ncbi:MAG: hypothetical protein ACKO9F_01340 [Caldilinea sp.]
MSKKEALIALWRLLAELYDDKAKAKRLAEQSGINPVYISADDAAADYWWRILLEAHKRGKVQEIVKNASWEIEERAGDLKQANRTYADAPDTGDLLEAPTMAPGQGGGISIGKIEATNVSMRDQYIFERGEINMGNETKIDTGGGAVVGGSVYTGGGHFVGRDMTVQGDKVGGDKVGVGDVSGTGVAIGSGASVQIGPSADKVAQALAPVLTALQQSTVDVATQAAAMQEIEKLKAELAKGKDADDSRIAGILDGLANLVPGAVAAIVSTFGTPLLVGIAGPVTQFVLNQFKRK